MKTVNITEKAHKAISEEIKSRRAAGEVPKPTYTSIIEEKVCGK